MTATDLLATHVFPLPWCVQVNYPSADIPFTRITEYKHLPNQPTESGKLNSATTLLMKEFSSDTGEPFYPVPAPRNRVLYEKYRDATLAEKDVVFVGRLASYKYFNMDAAVLNALSCADCHVSGVTSSWKSL